MTQFKVYRHPEWQFPLRVVIFTELAYQIIYYLMILSTFCSQVAFCTNANFATMLLDSTIVNLKCPNKAMIVLRQFANAFHTLIDLNRFWSSKMGNYYLLILPASLPFVYVFFYVPANVAYKIRVIYVLLLYPFSMLLVNWTAGRVSTASRRIYHQLYSHGMVMQASVSTQLKVKN